MTIDLRPTDVQLLLEALDSHEYWQLSDQHYRRDGFVMEPGSDAPAVQRQIKRAEALATRLHGLLEKPVDTL
jgi:succinylglutamate desuccinylase